MAVEGSREDVGAVMRDAPGRRCEGDLGMRGEVGWVDVVGWGLVLEGEDIVWGFGDGV